MFNIFTKDLENGVECILRKSAADTKPGGVVDTLDVCAAIQRDLDMKEMR